MSTLEKALEIATAAHAGAKDKQGDPYILHPIRVMHGVEGEEARIVALLHDVVEDTDVTLDDIRAAGFSEAVVEGLDLVTHRKDRPYSEYVIGCRKSSIATQVKLSDLRDNAALSRAAPRGSIRERLEAAAQIRALVSVPHRSNLRRSVSSHDGAAGIAASRDADAGWCGEDFWHRTNVTDRLVPLFRLPLVCDRSQAIGVDVCLGAADKRRTGTLTLAGRVGSRRFIREPVPLLSANPFVLVGSHHLVQPVNEAVVHSALSQEEPYLRGNFKPVTEELTSEGLKVTGDLPEDLQGIYVSNSSNPKFRPKGKYHWFDGDGMVHGVELRDGVATYRNRYVRTEGLKLDEEAGESLYRGIREDPDPTLPDGPFKDTGNTDLIYHAGRLLALWWLGGKARQLRLPELETIGNYDFGGELKTGISAHAKVDPRTGEMIMFDYGITPPFLTYGVVSAHGEITHFTPIDLPSPRAQHDIALTERYTLVFDMPMFFDPAGLKVGKMKTVFDKSQPARIGVVERHGTDVRWFEVEAFYMYHTINAYEEGDEIILLGCRIADPLSRDRSGAAERVRLGFLDIEPYLSRWRLNLSTGQATTERLDDIPTEFPRTNDSLLGVKQRYSYNPIVAREPQLLFEGFIKYDTLGGKSESCRYGRRRWGGETTFVPRAAATAEDDGYVLTFLSDEIEGTSELLIFDAREIDRGPIASVALPQRLPALFHAKWVSADEMAQQQVTHG